VKDPVIEDENDEITGDSLEGLIETFKAQFCT
jgi:hypothetical protein